MKKIIAAIDGLKYSDSAVHYAVHLAQETNAHLVGVFLDDFTYHSYKIYELVSKSGGVDEEKHKRLEIADQQAREASVNNFSKACREASLNFSVHHDRNIALHELLHESIYADLMVIGNKETLTHYEETIPTRFIRDLLSEVQCPVLVVPTKYKPLDKLVLLYDGQPSSVHAIRTFSSLFPELKYLETEVISVRESKGNQHVPDNRLMKEFMKRHFPQAYYTVLQGYADTEIPQKLKTQEGNILVVLGAYERSRVSRWFRESLADILMQEIDAPLFIAHSR
ncbi:universal stress protein [Niastella caeni]|uniref:Universal stress protein n=1 Tax=Niastella caeni TaxID=2569763 RepID=A0A4S8HVU2_9BACT|nr:universal stress protein [Niastella caeni]THU39535.1 universal stress protein [Niastella caeni]